MYWQKIFVLFMGDTGIRSSIGGAHSTREGGNEISSTRNEVIYEFLNLCWMLKHESNVDQLWIWCMINVIEMPS
jgi:hypothetical protein